MPESSNQSTLSATISDKISMPNTISDTAQRGELPKLIDDGTNNNYGDWASRCYHLLRTWGLWKYIAGSTSIPPDVPALVESKIVNAIVEGELKQVELPGNATEREKKLKDAQPWMDGNNLTLTKFVSAAPELQMHLVENEVYAKQAWENLGINYKPLNSSRATTIKGNITGYRCTTQMDVSEWLTDMQRMYGDLCRVDRQRMTSRDFALVILDNMPQSDSWEVIATNLRDKIQEANDQPAASILAQVVTKIRDVCWHHNRDSSQATHVFATHAGAFKNNQKRPRAPGLPGTDVAKRSRIQGERFCTNPHCGAPSSHTFEECVAYGGGSQGKYGTYWKGPWNIHLHPQQRTRANNVPPPSHPRSASRGKPIAHQVYYPPGAIPQTSFFPTSFPTTYSAAQQVQTPSLPPPYPVAQQVNYVPTIPPPVVTPAQPLQINDGQTRASIPHCSQFGFQAMFSPDDQNNVQDATTNETPAHVWNFTLEDSDEPLQASLPVLDRDFPRTDDCHHDSGANRHVFHDRSVFETYQSIKTVAVKGFGRDLSTPCIGRGTVRVQGQFGNRTTPILLANAPHIPAARANLISGPQLDNAGVTSTLGDGLAILSKGGINIVGGSLQNEMYKLNMTIVRPSSMRPLSSRLSPPNLISRIGPIAAAASSDQAGFYIA